MQSWITLASIVVGLILWRIQLVAKRRFEVAEEALIAFASAKDAITYVRNPFSFGGEGRTRERSEGEAEEDAQRRDRHFVPFERLNTVSDKFSGLYKTQLLCRYHFGEDAYNALGELFKARQRVRISASLLAKAADRGYVPENRMDEHLKRIEKWEADIWVGADEDDKISKALDDAQKILEKVCTPYLAYRTAFWPFLRPV